MSIHSGGNRTNAKYVIIVLLSQAVLQGTCAFTLAKNHTNAKCVINVLVYLAILQRTCAFILWCETIQVQSM